MKILNNFVQFYNYHVSCLAVVIVVLPRCKSLYTVAWRFQVALTALLFIGLSWNLASLCIFRRWIRIWYLDIAIVISFSVILDFFLLLFLEEQWPCQATNIYISHKTARVVQLLLLYDIIHLGAIPSNQIQTTAWSHVSVFFLYLCMTVCLFVWSVWLSLYVSVQSNMYTRIRPPTPCLSTHKILLKLNDICLSYIQKLVIRILCHGGHLGFS